VLSYPLTDTKLKTDELKKKVEIQRP